MAEVIWLETAINDLRRIISYIEQFDPTAAANMGSKLYSLGESLARFPQRGRPAADGSRELITVAPYVIAYSVRHDRVTILSIRHGRQQQRP